PCADSRFCALAGFADVAVAEGTLQQVGKLGQLGIAACDVQAVAPDQRKIGEIASLAIPIPEAAENAEHLDVPLQADQLEPARYGGETGFATEQMGGVETVAIAFEPARDTFRIPFDITIAQQ